MVDRYLITGGAGFIGSNYADYLLGRGAQVTIFDNLSRRGADKNLAWLREGHGADSFELLIGDVRDPGALDEAVAEAEGIVHLAGQVGVTSSVVDPRSDFEINALGSFNVLEAARKSGHKPFVIYSSTNKVYGEMTEHRLIEQKTRYRYARLSHGLPETQQLDFHSPYGCSKGTAEQYVRDYARIYGMPSVVLRQSCIYGPRHTLSIWAECGPMLEKLLGRRIPVKRDKVRPGDQKVYVSDIRKAKKELGWAPTIGVEQGVGELVDWVQGQRSLFD